MTAPSASAFDLRLHADMLVLQADEMDPEAFDAALASFVEAVDDKAAVYHAVYFAAEARHAAIAEEAERFATAEKRAKGRIDRIKDGARALLEARETVGEKPKIVGAWGSMRLQRNSSPSVEIIDPAQVPDGFKIAPPPPPPAISRDLILAAFKRGEEVPGAAVTIGRHVRIA